MLKFASTTTTTPLLLRRLYHHQGIFVRALRKPLLWGWRRGYSASKVRTPTYCHCLPQCFSHPLPTLTPCIYRNQDEITSLTSSVFHQCHASIISVRTLLAMKLRLTSLTMEYRSLRLPLRQWCKTFTNQWTVWTLNLHSSSTVQLFSTMVYGNIPFFETEKTLDSMAICLIKRIIRINFYDSDHQTSPERKN